MNQRIGTCSICGGDVVGYVGAWHSILPPPPPECASCGAIPAGMSDVIPMAPAPPRRSMRITTTGTMLATLCGGCGSWPCKQTTTGCRPLDTAGSFTVSASA